MPMSCKSRPCAVRKHGTVVSDTHNNNDDHNHHYSHASRISAHVHSHGALPDDCQCAVTCACATRQLAEYARVWQTYKQRGARVVTELDSLADVLWPRAAAVYARPVVALGCAGME